MQTTKAFVAAALLGSASTAAVGQFMRLREPAEVVVENPVYGAHEQHETWYAAKLAPRYQARCEVVCDPGGARCDLVNATEAIEVDWAPKWAEAIGQSLYYAEKLDLKPGIILLTESQADAKFVARCREVCRRRHINLHVEPVGAIK